MAPDRVPSTTAGPEGAEAGQDEGAERLLAAKRRRGTRADVEEEEAGGGGDAAVAVGTPSASSMKLPWAEEFAAGEAWITTQAAIVVNAYGSVQGRVLLTTQSLYFHPDRHLLPPAKGEREEEGGEEDGTGKEAGGGTVAKGQARRRKRGAFAYQWKDKKWRCVRVYICLFVFGLSSSDFATPLRYPTPHQPPPFPPNQKHTPKQAEPRDGGARPPLSSAELRAGGLLLGRARSLPRLPHAQGPRCVRRLASAFLGLVVRQPAFVVCRRPSMPPCV